MGEIRRKRLCAFEFLRAEEEEKKKKRRESFEMNFPVVNWSNMLNIFCLVIEREKVY